MLACIRYYFQKAGWWTSYVSQVGPRKSHMMLTNQSATLEKLSHKIHFLHLPKLPLI